MKMIITDLDNTLYDWVTFFANSFNAMVDELSILINIEKEKLLDEFKKLHQYYGNTERPFTIFELPSVKQHYGEISRIELFEKLDKPLYAFNSKRKRYLKLYEKVEETLFVLKEHNFTIVGYTEAIDINGYYRLKKLGIDKYFTRLYATQSNYDGHPNSVREKELKAIEGFIRTLPKEEKKPNHKLLLDICNKEGIDIQNTFYIGDSLTKDIAMAKEAGIQSIWAKYGRDYNIKLWDILVRVTHWTEEDVKRESDLKKKYGHIEPDYIINKFDEILSIVGIEHQLKDIR